MRLLQSFSVILTLVLTASVCAAQTNERSVSEGEGSTQSPTNFSVLQRADVIMKWSMVGGEAAVKWTSGKEISDLAAHDTRIALAAFLYARTIVNHAETRRALIERTEPAAVRLVQGGKSFEMNEWRLEAGGLSFPIYPWQFVTTNQLQGERTYTVYLYQDRQGLIWGMLNMAHGYERILAPAAPLLVFRDLANTLPASERVILGRVIRTINDFFSRLDLDNTASLIGTDALMMAALIPMLEDERSFARNGGIIAEAELRVRSEDLAKQMGTIFARQQVCGLQSSVSPDRAVGFFINYMIESEVKALMEEYEAGMREAAGRVCNRAELAKLLAATMADMRAYVRDARPALKKW